jgi:hopene-associated glycosyltransferase HpnB
VTALAGKLKSERLDQVSVMATMPTGSLPEKLLLPAFVFFFKQLYPFAWVNRPERPFAAAAGGCILVRRDMLTRIGAFEAWKDALIDDCELARRVRAAGGRLWLGLDDGVRSQRRHPDFGSLLATVRRTAYVQLGRSPLLLAAVAVIMFLMFVVPPLAVLSGLASASPVTTTAGAAAWLLSGLAYVPQVRFQRLHPAWSLSLPVAGGLFLAATLDSALRHHFGTGADWKGRSYPR